MEDTQKPNSHFDNNESEEDFATLFSQSEKKRGELRAGQIAQGKIVSLFDTEVLVDVGGRAEGVLSREEITAGDGRLLFQVGDVIPVMLGGSVLRDGQLRLSYSKANKVKQEEALIQAIESGKNLEGKVVEVVKGGFLVDMGMRAFVPISQMDDRPIDDPKPYVGQTYEFRVMEHDLANNKLVLSRRVLLREDSARRKKEFLSALSEGQRYIGTVTRIMDFGVFVDIGGVEGLLHISSMSWRRISHPSDLFKTGDQIEVEIIKFDLQKERISLSYRKEADDPWKQATSLYPEGKVVRGSVQKLEPFGAFIELESGIQGLIPISEMSWTKRISHPKQVLKVGDNVETMVLRLDPVNRKLSLSLKQIAEHPWIAYSNVHKPGEILKGKISRVAEFGLFVELAEGIEGMVHFTEISDSPGRSSLDGFKDGQEVKVKILSLDAGNKKISLSIKAIAADEAKETIQEFMNKTQQSGSNTLGDMISEDLRRKLFGSQ
jgi:small subunit ribosomal protein S1